MSDRSANRLFSSVTGRASRPSPSLVAERALPGEPGAVVGSGRSADRPVRMDLVQRVRAAIAAGHYDTPGKIDFCVDRLLCELVEPQTATVSVAQRSRNPHRG